MQAVRQVCEAVGERHARVVQDSSLAIYIYDARAWPKEANRLLLLSVPNAEVSVMASAASLSGFVVVVQEGRQGWQLQAALAVLLLALCGLCWLHWQKL